MIYSMLNKDVFDNVTDDTVYKHLDQHHEGR